MNKQIQLSKKYQDILQEVFDYFNVNSEWPTSVELNIKLRKMGDLWDNAKAIGFDIIDADRYNETSRTRLTIMGLSLCRGSKRILDIFLKVISLCWKRYIESPLDARLTGSEIDSALNTYVNDLKKVVNLLRNESKFSSGHNNENDPFAFELRISKEILKYEDIYTIEDYLRIAYPWMYQPTNLDNDEHIPEFKTNFPSPSDQALLSISDLLNFLNPAICDKCNELFMIGKYSEAVEKAFKVVKDKLRDLTGFEKATDSFGRGKLHINGAAAPHVERDFNEGVKFLCMAIDKFRNEATHTSESRINDPGHAYEYLNLCSLAMNLLSEAVTNSKESSK
ncbi:MAG: TIGR02391 family protein [Candidatus Hodarchaeales archaeon]|jgi:uncharacterized protein (TIGR02391 family)